MKEYGGYLPLELAKQKEYYSSDDIRLLCLNSGRNAIIVALQDGNYSKIYLPLYICKSVIDAIKSFKIEYKYYHIDAQFMPIDIEPEEGAALLWVNYFGINHEKTLDILKSQFSNLIVDNTQAFFYPPSPNIYNIYSCRKFIGVCDGAYLISEKLKPRKMEQSTSWERSVHLIKSIDCGTDAAYSDSLYCERTLDIEDIKQMSIFTQTILCAVDYENIQNIRMANFEYYDSMLGKYNGLTINPIDYAPIVYPFFFEENRLRDYLLENKIYVPQWWQWVHESGIANTYEDRIAQYLFLLPIDQRYTLNDIKHITDLIKNYIQS